MLWLPPRSTLKAIARLKRRRRRRRIARIILYIALIFILTTATVPPRHALMVEVQELTKPYDFNFVNWISLALVDELERWVSPPPSPASQAEQQALVQQYLDLERDIRQLERDINQAYAAADRSQQELDALEQELDALQTAQAVLTPQVEMIIANQIEAVLKDEGFNLFGQVPPPVAFRLLDPPTGLILSPRDKIERQHFVGLQPGLDVTRRAAIEDKLQQRGDISSYVTNIGGLGSYPSMVVATPWLPWLIDTIAHEWTHNYLYTFPSQIAWGYASHPKLTTINETTASLVGEEISRQVIEQFYPEWIDALPPLDNGQPVAPALSEFDMAMRRIRQQVDQLLATGKIDEAEQYMETERLKLVKKGYNLRVLNQAYFAFHGSYALGPTSVDPTGEQIRQLRANSESLKDFLDKVGWLNSPEDFNTWLSTAGLGE